MKTLYAFLVATASCSIAMSPSHAVELLISGDFETPMGVGDIPGWRLTETVPGATFDISTATFGSGVTGLEGDQSLFLQAFSGGGPSGTALGNFDGDGLPQGQVGGSDFLIWQRNFGRMEFALPEEGDANEDGNVDAVDLSIWGNNVGRKSLLGSAILTQTVPISGGPNQTFTFKGSSNLEDNYSGLFTTLDAEGPFGAIPSPTQTRFKMEFLDAAGDVLGAPTTLDVAADFIAQNGLPGSWLDNTPLVSQAPTGAVRVRVTAEAIDMAWNGAFDNGLNQSAFFDLFSLRASGAPNDELLANAGLDDVPPNALDFWTLATDPDASENDEILRTPIAGFSNHTPGGTRGVWLSAFFGAHPSFEPDPVDGVMSQTVQAVEGGEYTFSGWTKFEQNYSGGVDTISSAAGATGFFAGMTSPTQTTIELAFLDGNGDVIGTPLSIDVKESRRQLSPTGNPNDEQWYQHILTGVAPTGTVSARLTGAMLDAVYNVNPRQSAFFDDFSLDGPAVSFGAAANAVPEPASCVMLVLGCAMVGRRRQR